jgi:hypothetical protein
MSLAHDEDVMSDDSFQWKMLHVIGEWVDLWQMKRQPPLDLDRFHFFIGSLPTMMNVPALERFISNKGMPLSNFGEYFVDMHNYVLHTVNHSSKSCTKRSNVKWMEEGTSAWGPVFWKTYHLWARNSADNPRGRKLFIENFFVTLPCPTCRIDTANMIEDLKNDLDEIVLSREKTSQLFIDIHDQVNKKLGKKMFQKPKFLQSENVKKYIITFSAISVVGFLMYFIYNKTRKNKSFTVTS